MSKQTVYVLSWKASTHPFDAQVKGVFTSLDAAKTEAQRYNKKETLQWTECVTDKKGQIYLFAPLTTWFHKVDIEITSIILDAKEFRPV